MPVAILGSPPFQARMRAIRQFFIALDAVQVYAQLLDDLEHIVFPNLGTFPLIGKLYLDGPARSTEALTAVAKLPRDAADQLRQYIHGDFAILYAVAKLPRDAAAQLRQYVHGDFTILYAVAPDAIHLISIRHHRESMFTP